MTDLPVRKDIRLKGYDYSQTGAYFITICVKDRAELLSEIVGANCVRPHLSGIGNIVEEEISVLSRTYAEIRVSKYVIMPNHIHMIIAIEGGRQARSAPTISRAIKQFKGSVTKRIGRSVWQRSYYERVIRGESEYQDIWCYIDENPLCWVDDCYYAGQR